MASVSGREGQLEVEEAGPDVTRGSLPREKRDILAIDDQFLEGAEIVSAREVDEVWTWMTWEKLPSFDRLRTTLLSKNDSKGNPRYELVDIEKTGPELSQLLMSKLFQKGVVEDNDDFLLRLRNRLDKVDLKTPTLEVRFENLSLQAACRVGDRILPTLPNSFINGIDSLLNYINISFIKKGHIDILREVSGIIKRGRMTLLLGPPSSGRTSLLLALAAALEHSVKQRGKITYNGHTLDEFLPQKTASSVGQSDLHSGELTVRETLDFSSLYQGVGTRYDLLIEVAQREKDLGIHPDADIDLYMKATGLESISHNFVSDYIMKILGLEVCADTLVGDEMRRGISGGQKKRLTIGEILVGPSRTFFMDEISNGLDSATAFQIISCLSQFAHTLDMTFFIALLQPAPEIFEIFDDIVLLSEGQIVYNGPRENVEEFFASCGFKCPPRKGVADFLQEVTSRKDQEQYWVDKKRSYKYVSVDAFSQAFKKFHVGIKLYKDLATPYDKSQSHGAALTYQALTRTPRDLFKIALDKEILYLKRNTFIYAFKTTQILVQAVIISAVFFRTELHKDTYEDSQLYGGAIFTGALCVIFSGFIEVTLTVARLPVFYKQRDMKMIPAWTFALSIFLPRIPIALLESVAFLGLTYYPIGFAPGATRFLRTLLVYVSGHLMASSLFRLLGAFCQTMILANSIGSAVLTGFFILGGYLVPRSRMKHWWIWGYWIDPVSWILTALYENEFLSSQWQDKTVPGDTKSLGDRVLHLRGYYPHDYWYWISVGAINFFTIIYNVLFIAALTYLRAPERPKPIISDQQLAEIEANRSGQQLHEEPGGLESSISKQGAVILPTGDTAGSAVERTRSSRSSGSDRNLSVVERTRSSASALSRAASAVFERTRSSASALSRASSTSAEELREARRMGRRGMVLPYQPLSISFSKINYFVDMPAEMKERGATGDQLQLLDGITGAFRPGILTALVGVTGAGKSTLMDVLLGRKTKGIVKGDINISGYPKNQETFARIAGYVEQTDVHSPRLTVHESIVFSAWLRLSADIDTGTREAFVEEVIELTELTSLRNSIVGLQAVFGLSTEQRKRLSIAVELVANPSIIFMDEPTSGLDARAAAIVMRAVRNTVDTGRTVVCTIHQPSIDIFESFDELLLLKLGGKAIYAGPLGRHSRELINYFQKIPGIPDIKEGINPATWMLEVTSTAMERKLGIDFAEIYIQSSLYQQTEATVEELSKPAPGSRDLYFETQYSQSSVQQFLSCLWKINLTYWRTPEYNNVRYFFTTFVALVFGTLAWHDGGKRNNQFDLSEIMGVVYTSGLLTGISMATTVQPLIGTERGVFYRERAAGMYAAIPCALAQVLIEIPYTLLQTILYTLITYSMINLEWRADKFFLYLYFSFFTTITYSYYGMMSVALTPSTPVAAVLSNFFYVIWNVFSGFICPKPKIPVWVSWYYWACPMAWTIYGQLIGQFGDLDHRTLYVVEQGEMTIPHYLRKQYGYRRSWLGFTIGMNAMFPVVFAFAYVYAIKYINYQNR